MALSLGIGCGGNNNVSIGKKFRAESGCNLRLRPVSLWIPNRSIGWCRSPRLLVKANTATVTKATVVPKSPMDLSVMGMFDEENQGRCEPETEGVEACERLDEWMRKSVEEIVKNLKEAPLLVQVYQDKRSGNFTKTRTATTFNTEKKAVEEDWPILKEKWGNGETSSPDGLIFVEEISSDESENEEREAIGGGSGRVRVGRRSDTSTRAWGVVVQGKGLGCGPVCYLLKTSRVGAGTGLGLHCTHFVLVRVKNFRETAHTQLKNCWLLQNQ